MRYTPDIKMIYKISKKGMRMGKLYIDKSIASFLHSQEGACILYT